MSMKSAEIPPRSREEVWSGVPRLRFCGNLHLNIFRLRSWGNFLFRLRAECYIKLLFPPLKLSVKELLMYLGNLCPPVFRSLKLFSKRTDGAKSLALLYTCNSIVCVDDIQKRMLQLSVAF